MNLMTKSMYIYIQRNKKLLCMWAALRLAFLSVGGVSILLSLCLCLSPPTSTSISFFTCCYRLPFIPSCSPILGTANHIGSPHDELTYGILSFFKVTSQVWAALHLTHPPAPINTFLAQTISPAPPHLCWAVNKAIETRKGCWLID